ncbi:MAG TPA: c-type cytochrome domain-containing protein [Anaerolineales bacterium]|nr:c-type cytochrome domain-containing protein [Anaerolineales bacterium]
MTAKFIVIIIMAVLISACGSQPTEVPTSTPTEIPATATEIPTNTPSPTDTPLPTETAVPPTETPPAEPALVSFNTQVKPILSSRCFACHGGSRGTEEGLEFSSHQSLMAGSDNGPVIVPGNADESLLVELIVNNEMPKRGPKLTPLQVQLIIDWINQGALDN